MPEYQPPLADIGFVLDHLIDLTELYRLEAFSDLDRATIGGLLEEAGRFATEVIAPLNRVGDQQGSRLLEDGTIATPDGFRAAYDQWVKAGWGGAHFPTEWGGGGLPYTIGVALQELVASACLAFSLCPMLTQSAIEAILHHGTVEQRGMFLEKLVTGAWTGTMNLSEPGAGSDVGALRTKAVAQPDGTYRLSGMKIFITWGDHDLTENVVHLVLARTPGAAPGTKGISLFLVPKYLVNPDGTLGRRNDVRVVSLEHKLGIHASPTCVLAFGEEEGAVGHIVGEEQAGMRYMFTMMNSARLGVGLEGLALTERSYQQALRFAAERRQGRAVGAPVTETSLIIEHPDVQRMLLTMRAYGEAMRAFLYSAAFHFDLSRHHPDPAVRAHHEELVGLYTPIAKAWSTDLGVELTSLGIQVHGGMGYVEETGVAQHLRDARIAPIYEGTNGIQAIDLVLRKLPIRNGALVNEVLAEIAATAEVLRSTNDLKNLAPPLEVAVQAAHEATDYLLERRRSEDALAGATPYLRLLGTLLGGWMMARQALAAVAKTSTGDRRLFDTKLGSARFYVTQLLPHTAGLLPAVKSGAAALTVATVG